MKSALVQFFLFFLSAVCRGEGACKTTFFVGRCPPLGKWGRCKIITCTASTSILPPNPSPNLHPSFPRPSSAPPPPPPRTNLRLSSAPPPPRMNLRFSSAPPVPAPPSAPPPQGCRSTWWWCRRGADTVCRCVKTCKESSKGEHIFYLYFIFILFFLHILRTSREEEMRSR